MRDEPYAIEWAGPAQRTLGRLPEKVATASVGLIYGALAEQPRRVGRPLRFDLENLRSAHRGDFRVVYRINAEDRRIYIELIRHRADVYRRS